MNLAATTQGTLDTATTADANAATLLADLQTAANDADTALTAALADETQQDQEADAADEAAGKLAAEDQAAFNALQGIIDTKIDPRQLAVDQAAATFTNEDQERTDSEADAVEAEAELADATQDLDDLNP